MRKMRRRSTRKMRKTMMEKVCKTVCGGAGGVRVTPVDVSVKHVVVQVMKRMKKRTKTRRRAA